LRDRKVVAGFGAAFAAARGAGFGAAFARFDDAGFAAFFCFAGFFAFVRDFLGGALRAAMGFRPSPQRKLVNGIMRGKRVDDPPRRCYQQQNSGQIAHE
jgi:hypothetical protein